MEIKMSMDDWDRLRAAELTLVDLGFTHHTGDQTWTPPKSGLPPHLKELSLEDQFRQVLMALGYPSAAHLSAGDVGTAALSAMKPFLRPKVEEARAAAEGTKVGVEAEKELIRQILREELDVRVKWRREHDCPAILYIDLLLNGEVIASDEEEV